jgi:intein/homing endonuclease
MAEQQPENIFGKLSRLFSTDVIIKNVGGKQLKVIDFNRFQQLGNVKTNSLIDRYTRMYRFQAGAAFNSAQNYETMRIQLYNDYEAMDTEAIIASTLDILADECTLKNEQGEVLQIRSADENIQRILYNLFYDVLNIEFNLWMWIRSMCKYGDFYLHLEIAEKFGIYNVTPMSAYDIIRQEGQDKDDPTNISKVTFKIDPTSIAGGGYSSNRSRDILQNYEVTHFRLLTDANLLPYGRCASYGTRIYTENGIKEIQDITTNDKVWTFNILENKYEIANVLATCNSGIKKLFKITTIHNEIKITDNHPLLVWDFYQNQPNYKQVKDISVGDYIASYKNIDFNLNNPKLNKNINIDESKRNQFLIDKTSLETFPEYVTSELARFWGFMLGDGWTNKTCNTVGFARGINGDRNKYYENLLLKFSGKTKLNKIYSKTSKVKKSGVSVSSTIFYQLMKLNGYIGKSYSKRLPQWIYECNEETQLSLVKGLIDADGYIFTDKWGVNSYNLTLNNYELLKDLKILLDRLKIKTGKIRSRKFTGKCNILDKEYNAKQAYDFTFYLDGQRKSQYKKFDKINSNYNIELYKIQNIVEELPDETYDICVSKNSNFIADGLIIHNSYIEPARKTFKQYVLIKDAMLLHRITRAPDKRVHYINVGSIPPNEVDAYMQKLMNKMKKTPFIDSNTGEYNLRYNVQNMMEDIYVPVRGNDQSTKIETLPGLQYNAIEDVQYLRDEMLSALKVPKAYFGFDANLQGKATLSAEDMRFARTIERIQKIVLSELYQMALTHLFIQGYDGDSLTNFDLSLTNPSIVYEQEKVALYKEKMGLAQDMLDSKIFPSDYIYDNIFKLSDDNIEEYRDLVIEDQKRNFRLSQIENEGNDPAQSGKSYGTPHDLATLYGSGRMGQGGGEVPSGYSEKEPVGRPEHKNSLYGTQDSNLGKDPIGKEEATSTNQLMSKGEGTGTAKGNKFQIGLAEYLKSKARLASIPKKDIVFKKNSLLSEINSRNIEI